MLPILNIGPLAIQTPGLIILFGTWLGFFLAERQAGRREPERLGRVERDRDHHDQRRQQEGVDRDNGRAVGKLGAPPSHARACWRPRVRMVRR